MNPLRNIVPVQERLGKMVELADKIHWDSMTNTEYMNGCRALRTALATAYHEVLDLEKHCEKQGAMAMDVKG